MSTIFSRVFWDCHMSSHMDWLFRIEMLFTLWASTFRFVEWSRISVYPITVISSISIFWQRGGFHSFINYIIQSICSSVTELIDPVSADFLINLIHSHSHLIEVCPCSNSTTFGQHHFVFFGSWSSASQM